MNKTALTNFFYYFFLSASFFGGIVCVLTQFLAFFGYSFFPDKLIFSLTIGVFVVSFPAIPIASMMTREVTREKLWDTLLFNCPDWLKTTVHCAFLYAIVNFILTIALKSIQGNVNKIETIRMFSAHFLPFYFGSFAIYYAKFFGKK